MKSNDVRAILAPSDANSKAAATRKSRWAWLVVGLLVVGVLAFLGWAWFAPLPVDEGFFIDRRMMTEHFTAPGENAFWDYAEFPAVDTASDWARDNPFTRAVEAVEGRLTVSRADVAAAQAYLHAHPEPMECWQSALQRPIAVGQIPFDENCYSAELLLHDGLVEFAKIRLIAAIETPAEFARALRDLAHAVATNSHDAPVVSNAVMVVLLEIARRATEAHLALADIEFSAADFATLDAALAELRAAMGPMESAVANELVWQHASEPQMLGMLPPGERFQFEWLGRQSRENRVRLETIRELDALADVPNAGFHAHSDIFEDAIAARFTAWERFRMKTFSPLVGMPIYFGLFESARQAQTGLLLLQWACRIEAYRNRTGELPATLADVAGELAADRERLSAADDWETDGRDFHFEIFDLVGPNDEPRQGYYLASSGGFAWMGVEITAQNWPSLVVEIRPGNFAR